MIRVLLFLLAILVAVLGFVLQRPWLYAAAAVPLAGGLALVARRLWTSYGAQQRQRRSRSSSARRGTESKGGADRTSTGPRGESLEDFGIVDVRPQEAASEAKETASASEPSPEEDEAASDPAPDRASSEAASSEAASEAEAPAARSASNAAAESASAKPSDTADDEPADTIDDTDAERASAETEAAPDPDAPPAKAETNGTPPSTPDDAHDPLLTPYVEALRVALDAHTACFLVQSDVALQYDIRAIASAEEAVQRRGTFETKNPLLTPQMMEEPITIRPLDRPDVVSSYLGYYHDAPPIDHVALAPVSVSGQPAVHFLLADSTGDVELGTKRAGALLKRFADTLSLVLEKRAAEASAADAEASEATAGEDEDSPRPRTEIIAEEMEAADAANDPLSLLLVHLNRAEALAREGEGTVQDAEARFAQRLDELAASSRVVRFGELTYGVFYRGDANAVEPFAADLQETMRTETGVLEGGVSIGVAVRDARHDPESLRADATEALSESYKTGACTIAE